MVSLWIRIGDAGDYIAHGDSLDDAIQELEDMGVGKVTGWNRGGLDTEHYRETNNISFFWGDRECNFSHSLYDHERKIVEQRLGVEE